MPSTDKRLMEYTPEELLMEFYEDLYEKKPNLQMPGDAELDEKEPIQEEIEPTGDALIDEIEKRMAKGENVDDLLDMMDPESRKAPSPNSVIETDGSFFKKKPEE